MNKVLRWAMVAGLSLAALSACSSDKAKPIVTTTTAAATSDGSTAATTASGAGTAGGSESVDALCKEIQDFAAKMKAALADPGNANSAALSAEGQKLGNDSAAMMQANPGDVQKVSQCAKVLTDVYAQATP
jgi:hypothetical protein